MILCKLFKEKLLIAWLTLLNHYSVKKLSYKDKHFVIKILIVSGICVNDLKIIRREIKTKFLYYIVLYQ